MRSRTASLTLNNKIPARLRTLPEIIAKKAVRAVGLPRITRFQTDDYQSR